MREFFILVAVLAPLFVLGLLERSNVEVPTWIRVMGISWFVAGSLYIGWYDGWLKRALVGVLIFIALMGTFLWWSGAIPNGWPTLITILLIAGSTTILVLIAIVTGWFEEVLGSFRRKSAKDSRAGGE